MPAASGSERVQVIVCHQGRTDPAGAGSWAGERQTRLDRVGDGHRPRRGPVADVADGDRVRAGRPGESGAYGSSDRQIGTSTVVIAGAVVTVLGTWVVAAWNAISAVFSMVAPEASPAVATVTWKLTVALALGAASRGTPVARAEAHHHPAAGELAQSSPAASSRGPVEADAARDERRSLRDQVLNVVPVAPSCGVLHVTVYVSVSPRFAVRVAARRSSSR